MNRRQSIVLGLILLVTLLGAILFIRNDGEPAAFEQITVADPIRVLFVGDIMLDRGVRNAINREGAHYSFEGIRDMFEGNDLVVGNLEGTFTNEASVSQDGTRLKFTFDPSLVTMLKEFNFSGFSLANNHTLDFSRSGFESTKEFLEQGGFFYFGSALNDSDLSTRVEVDGEVLCFVGYHELFDSNTSSVINELSTLVGECGYIVIFAHWGEEYKDKENESQRTLGRAFIDAGADLVIGHHPHVVQPIDIYKDKVIFYSLGNFLFDQDFSLPTRQSLAVRLILTESEQRFELVPIEMSRARLYYPEESSYASRMDVLLSKLPAEHLDSVRSEKSLILPRK